MVHAAIRKRLRDPVGWRGGCDGPDWNFFRIKRNMGVEAFLAPMSKPPSTFKRAIFGK